MEEKFKKIDEDNLEVTRTEVIPKERLLEQLAHLQDKLKEINDKIDLLK